MRRIIIYTSCFLLLVSCYYSQNRKLDSLNKILSSAPDTAKSRLLYEIAGELKPVDITRSLETASASLDLAIKHHNRFDEARASAMIATIWFTKSDFQKAMSYQRSAYVIMSPLKNEYYLARYLNTIGSIHYVQGNIDSAIHYYTRSAPYFEKIQDKKFLPSIYYNLGLVNAKKGNDEKALGFYLKALKLNEAKNDKSGIAMCLNTIGIVYRTQGNYEMAEKYYIKCLEIYREVKDRDRESTTLGNLANLYTMQKKYDKGLEYYKSSLAIEEELQDKEGKAHVLHNMGGLFQRLGQSEKALEHYEKSMALSKEIGDDGTFSQSLAGISQVCFDQGNYQKCVEYSKRSLEIAKKDGDIIQMKDDYNLLSKAYTKLNDSKNALEYHLLFFNLHDSIYTLEKSKQLNELQTLYETEKKDGEIKLLNADKTLKEAEIQKQKMETEKQTLIRNGFIAGFVLMIALAFFIFNGYRQKQKANIEISRQKEIIEEKNKDILDSINYAQRIQRSLLAGEKLLNDNLPEHFVLFKPKDIVAGDYYWATKPEQKTGTENEDSFIYVTADCTGHGVPGAFMSLLTISKLSETINEKKITRPDLILNNVRTEIIRALNPEGSSEESKDGMDCVLVKISLSKMELEYAAANNAFYIVRNNELIIYPADKMPVGKSFDNETSFTNHKVALEKGDLIYTFTDGYADQFGGPKGKKLKYKQLEDLILKLHREPLADQKQKLNEFFDNWKGRLEQIDDVCIIGVRV